MTKNQIESVSATRLLSGSIFQGYVCFPGRDLVSFHGLFCYVYIVKRGYYGGYDQNKSGSN